MNVLTRNMMHSLPLIFAVIKSHGQKRLMEEGVDLDSQLLLENPSCAGNITAGSWSQELRDRIFNHTESRESKLEVRPRCKFSNPRPSDMLFPSRLRLLKVPQSPKQCPNMEVYGGGGGSFHPNHHHHTHGS